MPLETANLATDILLTELWSSSGCLSLALAKKEKLNRESGTKTQCDCFTSEKYTSQVCLSPPT